MAWCQAFGEEEHVCPGEVTAGVEEGAWRETGSEVSDDVLVRQGKVQTSYLYI